MKRLGSLLLALCVIATFVAFGLGSSSTETTTVEQQGGPGAAVPNTVTDIAECSVEIKGCRLAKDWEGKDVVIVQYAFTNNDDEPKAFLYSFEDEVYQNGIGLNESWMLADSAKYSADNQTKEIKKGATLDVEVAYELNDSVTDIEVEVSALFSFDDTTITRTFSIT